ncbi:hypothetical protein LINPERHAP2_LOCUS22765 [Linum perenne]
MAAGKRDADGGSPRCAKMEVISQKKKSQGRRSLKSST